MEKLFPIEIPVQVSGKKMHAMVFGRVKESEAVGFHVRFSNSFEDFFYLAGEDDNLGPIGKKEGWEKYAPALKDDLRIIRDLKDGQFVKQFSHEIDGKPTNIWVGSDAPGHEDDNFYVYYKGECRFRMNRDEQGKGVVNKNYTGDQKLNELMAELSAKLIPVNA